jgi:hypothetical protein
MMRGRGKRPLHRILLDRPALDGEFIGLGVPWPGAGSPLTGRARNEDYLEIG